MTIGMTRAARAAMIFACVAGFMGEAQGAPAQGLAAVGMIVAAPPSLQGRERP